MNDTFTIITTFINGVGFPIAMCVYMAYFMNKTLKELTQTLHENTMSIRENNLAINEIHDLVQTRVKGVITDENK